MRPGSQKFKHACIFHFKDSPGTAADAEIVNYILGPNLGTLKGERVRRLNPHVDPGIDPVLH